MLVRNPRTLIIGTALAVLAVAASAPAHAANKPKPGKVAKPAASKSTLDLPALQRALESGDEGQMMDALDTIAKAGDAAGASLVEQLLTRGANPKVVTRAIDTLGRLAQPGSGVVLVPYAQHRTVEIRHAAVRALIATKAPVAGNALRQALRSSDPVQRSLAARGLGELGVRAAVPELFDVLPKDVPEAALSLGQLCVREQCERLVGLLGKFRFEVMEAAIVPLLLRPNSDVPDELKLSVVERLRRMATEAANRLLKTALVAFPADGSERVKRGIERALKGLPATEEGS